MANFTGGKQTSASSWQQIARGLIFAVVICRLVLSAPADGGQQKESNLANDHQQQQQQQTTNGCDRLFIANEKLAKYCLCKDRDLAAVADQPASGQSRDEQQQQQQQQISQLSCRPNDLAVLGEDLAAALGAAAGQHEESTSLQIDYLNISTNITSSRSIAPTAANTIAPADRWPHRQRFQIDHISLQFQMRRDESPPTKSQPPSRRNQAESQPATVLWVENQMIDFCGLINETRLQFLSISFGGDHEPAAEYELHSGGSNEIRLTRLLSRFSSLTRLELSLSSKLYKLLIERETFRHQPQLKWLSLASNKNLKLMASPQEMLKKRSPFSWATQLEYLNLESCNLRSFALFSLFQIQFKLASNQQQDSLANASHITTKSVFGLPNLTTLNLASNKLRSLEQDLFASIDNATDATRTICQEGLQPDSTSGGVFVLPSLTQLDLSENRLDGLGFRAAQYILCTMPNLSQLFLRRNNIKHLNLNSLLVYPTILPHSVAGQPPATATSSSAAIGRPSRSSRLEYLDLSSNELVQLSAFLPPTRDPSAGTRIKSINLSQNKLSNLITLLNSSLVDRLLFDESFNYGPSSDSFLVDVRLNQLDRWFKLLSHGSNQSRLSICDHLSPRLLSRSNNNNMEESLVNEILMDENGLTRVTRDDFAGQQCADIQILRMSANRIQSIGEGAFESLQNLEQLDLSSNQLVGLNATTFIRNLKLRILNLSRNKIKTIERRLFANLIDLEELLLNNNELVEIPGELFAHTTRLSVLDLSSNWLSYLEEATFSNLSSQLRVLNLGDNNLRQANCLSLFRHIDNGIVKTMNMLMPQQAKKSNAPRLGGGGGGGKKQQKNMTDNSSRAIEYPASKRVSKTRHNRDASREESSNLLDLSRNQIEAFNHAGLDASCDNQTFVRDVQTLWLNDNKLRELSRDSFACFYSIQRLHLGSNLLRTLEDSTFESLLELEFVDLSRNQLKRMDLFKLLPPLTTLKQADLSHNQLVALNLATSQTETQIELLDASFNVDLSIDLAGLVELIDKSAALRSLRFARTKLTSSSEDKQTTAIKNRLYLQSVDLSGSSMDSRAAALLHHLLSSDQILGIESLLVANIPDAMGQTAMQRLIASRLNGELELLNLSGNQLDNELVKLIMNASQTELALKHLDISSNLMDSWPLSENIAPKLSELKSVDLSRNRIRYLIGKNDTLTRYTLGQLEHLNLSSNAMIGLIAQPPAQSLQRISLGQLMPSLGSIDLSHNRLSWIPAQFFHDMPQLVRLRLDHNQIETFPSNLLLANNWPRRLVQLNFDHNTNMRSVAASADRSAADVDVDTHDHPDRLLLDDKSKFILATDRFNQLRCSQVDEYVSMQQKRPPLNGDIVSESQYLHSIHLAWQDNSIEPLFWDEDAQCQTLISLTRSISFNSIGPNATAANLATLWRRAADISDQPSAHKLYDLSFRRNDLRTIDSSFHNRLVVRLDLSENRIERLPAPSSGCRWPALMTLELSQNQIGGDLSLGWTLDCIHLTYLDLGHNRISSFVSSHQYGGESLNRRISSLVVLKLNDNSLTNLYGFPSHLLAALRLLDLRSNQLKSLGRIELLELQRPLLTVVGSNFTLRAAETDAKRPNIRVDDTSLRFDWPDSESGEHTMSVASGKAISYRERAADHPIKFCQLDPNSLTRICLQEPESGQQTISEEKCLILRVPKNTVPCSTDLKQSVQGKNNSSHDTNKSNSTYSHPFASGRNLSVEVEPKPEEDLVLNLIDSMKKSWLTLREVDINEYLNENMKTNSVWVELGNRYQINSLTVVKFAIVIGSICIIGLLVAVFTLLTYFSGSKVGPADSDAGSASELTTVTGPDSTSFSSSSNTNHNRSALTNCSNRSSDCSRTRTSLQSSSEEGQHLQETVLERIASKGSPDYHHNRQQQQQHPQICVTPSSSLAPSSIETAETMQAVDSIQSGTPNMARASIDQYTSAADMSNYHSRQQQDQLYQQQQQQVATVMRMVKSSSANFDRNAGGLRMHAPGSSVSAGGHYGTLNSRQNYSTLRTKLRHHGRPTLQQADDAGSHQLLDMSADEALAYGQQLGGTDPATMSLLSLSSALSNSSSANNFAASLHSDAHRVVSSAACEDDRTNQQQGQHNHLCQYHSNIMQQHNRQPVFVNQANHLTACQEAPEVIFEHEEDQQLSSSYNLDLSLPLAVHNLPPPPPPPRTMEALEFYDLNSSYTNAK